MGRRTRRRVGGICRISGRRHRRDPLDLVGANDPARPLAELLTFSKDAAPAVARTAGTTFQGHRERSGRRVITRAGTLTEPVSTWCSFPSVRLAIGVGVAGNSAGAAVGDARGTAVSVAAAVGGAASPFASSPPKQAASSVAAEKARSSAKVVGRVTLCSFPFAHGRPGDAPGVSLRRCEVCSGVLIVRVEAERRVAEGGQAPSLPPGRPRRHRPGLRRSASGRGRSAWQLC